MNQPFIERLAELLTVSTMTLATVSVEGQPHAAPVYFAAGDNLKLYFFSDLGSRHGQDTESRPEVAAAIYPECHNWRDIRGLQLHGSVRRVDPGPEWAAAWELYATKFPFVSELKEAVARNALYVFETRWARLVDNRQGFGFKEEWTLP
jgi:uncharacterized protein YhbP (UPF0306 family)